MKVIRTGSLCLLSFAALLTSGCLPTDSAEVGQLKQQVESLQQELDSLKSGEGGGDGNFVANARIDDLAQRITDIENARGQLKTSLNKQIGNQNTKLSRMFRDFNDVQEMVRTGQAWGALSLDFQGHTVVRTQHGAFLVELAAHEQLGASHRLQIQVGNPTGLHVEQFRISGEYGPIPPDHLDTNDYDAYLQATEEWEKSLKPYEEAYVTGLEPGRWTDLSLTIPTADRSQLQFIRLNIVIERARLEKSDFDDSFALTGIDSPQVPLLKTVHGNFPLDVRDSRPVSGGYEVDFYIGNPYTMHISNSQMVIRYGKNPPEFKKGDDPTQYRQELAEWNRSLKTIERAANAMILPFHWNQVRLFFPTSNREELAYMECRWGDFEYPYAGSPTKLMKKERKPSGSATSP